MKLIMMPCSLEQRRNFRQAGMLRLIVVHSTCSLSKRSKSEKADSFEETKHGHHGWTSEGEKIKRLG